MDRKAAHPDDVAHLLQSVRISSDFAPARQTENAGQNVSQRQQDRQTNFVPQRHARSFVREHEQQNRMRHDHGHQGSQGLSLMAFVKRPAQAQPQSGQVPQAQVLHQNHQPGGRHPPFRPSQFRPLSAPQPPPIHAFVAQCTYLDQIASVELPQITISPEELLEKERFFAKLQALCQQAILEQFPELQGQFSLVQYGSLRSGFAVKGSDMDTMLSWNAQPSDQVSDITPRLLEKVLLTAGHGARLLSKTRVPVLKICELPTEELQSALLQERKKWEESPAEDATLATEPNSAKEAINDEIETKNGPGLIHLDQSEKPEKNNSDLQAGGNMKQSKGQPRTQPVKEEIKTNTAETDAHDKTNLTDTKPKHGSPRKWVRERASGPLDFPKDGVGIQCDISFTRLLGIYNTHLLRCYCICDPRVRDMVLFVKGWAKRRQINSGYHGTLSSYGWVLMVLHFLINVARPPVLPNLQLDFGVAGQQKMVDGYNVNFADDDMQLQQLAAQGRLTQNVEPLGALLRNFFYYYAQQGRHVIAGGFNWRDSVISIRTRGGLLRKSEKGWTAATSVMVNDFEVRQRYILAIECPFETDHNVARTVQHNGVVAIRDELRRAWGMLEMTGNGRLPKEDLFAEIPDQKPGQQASQTPGPVDAKGTSRPSAETSAAKRFIVPANPAKTVV